jgi:hypothetical protein
MRLPAAALALFLLPASAPQDDALEMKWEFAAEDRFDLKWTFQETRRQEPGVGAVIEIFDRREVEAELTPKEDTPGLLSITLKKVSWTQGTHDYSVTAQYVEGKPLNVRTQVKPDPKSAGASGARAAAEQAAENLRKFFDGDYALDTSRRGETLVLRNGVAAQRTPSVFDKIFLHSPLPSGGVRAGQAWKDPSNALPLPAGLAEIKFIEYKVVSLNANAATVRGSVTVPIVRAPGNTDRDERLSGNFSYLREYAFARAGHLLSSKEESTFTKKVDAKVDFYRDNTSHVIKQQLTIKKRPPPKAEDAPK